MLNCGRNEAIETMKTTLQSNATAPHSKGFSLVEMIVVIAILGIISALAVPVLASVTGQAGEASHQRNAHSLASMANNAVAAGNVEIPAATSVDEVVDLLIAGARGTGIFEGTLFEVHNLSAADRVAAVALLSWDGGVLQYQSGT